MTQNNEREAFESLMSIVLKSDDAYDYLAKYSTPEFLGQYVNGDVQKAWVKYLENKASPISQNEQQPKQIPAGWISVKDRLPEKYTEVLVYPQPNEYTHCARYGKFKNKQIDDGWFYGEYEAGIGHENYTCKVTHWMPLPTAPTNMEVGE